MRRRCEEPDVRELAEQRLQEREKGAEDYIDHLYATGGRSVRMSMRDCSKCEERPCEAATSGRSGNYSTT